MTAARAAYLASLALAAAAIAIAVLMQGGDPPLAAPMADGFRSPILALEFASTPEDLAFLSGDDAAQLRAELQRVQALDTWFPIAYAGMAAAFLIGLGLSGRAIAWLGAMLALATIPADWWENAAIADILAALDAGQVPSLEAIQLTTWIKWGLIAGYAALTAAALWTDRRPILSAPSIAACLSVIAVAASGASGSFAEIMALVMLVWMLSYPLAAMLGLFTRQDRLKRLFRR